MVARKRRHAELESSEVPAEASLLVKIRNAWEFANLMQYIYIFGKAVKIDEDLDIEDLEQECCKPEPSKVLSDIGLALLKYVSSHRGLTPEIFNEYTRRQYVAKAPQRNPFGVEEEPKKFAEFDVFTKLKVLVQLSQWTLNNAERIREKMDERGEQEQSAQWRINEIGYDRQDRQYFALDDNRLYRRTEAPPPPAPVPKPNANSKKGKAMARASKRRRTRQADHSADDAGLDAPQSDEQTDQQHTGELMDDGFGDRKWECLAITSSEYQDFLQSIAKSRDQDEKALYKTITDDILPIIEQAEASQLRKKQRQERELLNMQKLASAKRSSRIEAKMEREKEEREALEAEQRRKGDLAEAEAYQKRQQKMEMDRESRMMTRDQRLKEREMKRILHEQELARMSEEEKKVDSGDARLSERHLKAEMDKKKRELAALEEEEEWTFDCLKCGKHGTNWDDGAHSVACEKCNVWQHSACLGILQADAEKDDFHFVCQDCTRREEDAKKPKIPSLKFRIGSSSSPPEQKPKVVIPQSAETKKPKLDDPSIHQYYHKKVKSLGHSQQVADERPLRPSGPYPNGIHFSTMHGSTPPTQSQPGNLQRPPLPFTDGQSNPRSPAGSSTHVNGYSQAHPNGYRPPDQFFQPPPFVANGYHPSNQQDLSNVYSTHHNTFQPQQTTYRPPQATQHPPHQSGWSARYIPPLALSQSHSPHGPPPAEQNPFATSPIDQRPSSSYHLPSAHGSNSGTSSAINNAPSLSPTQYRTPGQSFDVGVPSSSATPRVNGYATHNSAATQPIGPPSQSPIKQASPPINRPPHSQAPSSSPVTQQPSLPANGATSPGFSPMKQYPPQQQARPSAHKIAGNATTLAPVAKLNPSPVQPHPVLPVKPLLPLNAEKSPPVEPERDQH